MQRNPTRLATEDLTRAQWVMFRKLGDEISLTEDDRRRALDLDDHTWRAWTKFLLQGALPLHPPLPEMLRRLGEAAFCLSIVAENRHSQAFILGSWGLSGNGRPGPPDIQAGVRG